MGRGGLVRHERPRVHYEPTPKERLEGLAGAYRRGPMRLEHRIV
jgi:hypothetical protein